MSSPPTGTIAFLFTDIEGSTAAWDRSPDAMPAVLARHDNLVRTAIERHQGYVFATGGDGFAVAFSGAGAAVAAATDAQRALSAETWPDDLPIKVRMGVNIGEVDERDGDYFGPPVNRTARLMAVANGGQVVVSERAAEVLGALPTGTTLEPRGHHRLKDLSRPELIHEVVIDGRSGPALRTARAVAGNLPALRTSFIGRRRELELLTRLATEHRMVSLVGPGGAGKTRLAVEHAAGLADAMPDGAWFVDLTTATSDDVNGQLLTTLGLPDAGDWGALRSWHAHLVIDNCEHVVDAAADLVEVLLDECPGLRLVCTTRETLAVEGEHTMPVGSMPDDATRLFVERARAIDPGFEPTADELDEIGELCSSLDGLPLAIELAASRVSTSSVEELAVDLLGPAPTRRDRRRTGRHRSLRSAIEWSVELMDDDAATVFRRLGVFEGGFTLAAAQRVAADDAIGPSLIASAVPTLVEQSMVQSVRTPTGPRFSLLETVRAFALESLGAEEPAVRRRHLEWVTDWSYANSTDLSVPGWFVSTAEVANQRSALRFALDSGNDRAAIETFSASLWAHVSAGSFDFVQPMLARLRELPGAREPDLERRLDAAQMAIADLFGDFGTSHAIAERLRAGDDPDLWFFASRFVIHHFAATDQPRARRVLAEFEERSGVVPASSYLRAEIALGEANFAEAVDAILDAVGAGDVAGIERRLRSAGIHDAVIVSDLTLSLHLLGRHDEAALAADAFADATVSGPVAVYAAMLRAVTNSHRQPLGDTVRDLRETADLERRWTPPLVELDCLVAGALVAADLGRPEIAAEALGATKGRPQRSISGFGLRRELRRRLIAQLGDDAWSNASRRGEARSPREAFHATIDALDA